MIFKRVDGELISDEICMLGYVALGQFFSKDSIRSLPSSAGLGKRLVSFRELD